MNEQSLKTVELQINRLKNLPALPQASVQILGAINDPNVTIDKLAEVLSLSPGLLARLLGLANSAYFGKSRDITDIRNAIVQVLGLDLVKSLALGVVVNVQFDTGKCFNFDTEYFWTRSLLTAVAGQRLASRTGYQNNSSATVYNCGLLLYIGMLVTAYLFPEELNAIFFRCKQPDQVKVGDEMISRLGCSHYHLGYQVMRKWQLSAVYQSILQQFDSPGNFDENVQLSQILKAAQLISSCVADGATPDAMVFERIGIDSGVSPENICEVLMELYENKQNIQQLAQIMRG